MPIAVLWRKICNVSQHMNPTELGKRDSWRTLLEALGHGL
jgi:hypothetical protein